MKQLLVKLTFALLLIFLAGASVWAQRISRQEAGELAEQFVNYKNIRSELSETEPIQELGHTLAWIVRLEPEGFILIPSDERLCAVLAYSFKGSFDAQSPEWQEVMPFVKNDIRKRLQLAEEQKWGISRSRTMLRSVERLSAFFEQWPPAGATSSGGWLETYWNQSAPYNAMCPVDLNTGNRSLVGCPATAMAMILDYNKEIFNTTFTDDDGYFHNFGSGNQYMIDDAHEEHDFPSFPELNVYLQEIEDVYIADNELNMEQIAALSFACGIAAKQVYSSSVSGTYGVHQAHKAWQRFGYDTCKLVYPEDTTIVDRLKQNMMKAHPAQVGLVDGPPVTAGHNVVADGYNTDEFFHLNFGWGGQANAWYRMPPESAPYNLTSIEGIVLDIAAWEYHVRVQEQEHMDIRIFPLPAVNEVFIESDQLTGEKSVRVFSLDGRLLQSETIRFPKAKINVSELLNGLYLLDVEDASVYKLIK